MTIRKMVAGLLCVCVTSLAWAHTGAVAYQWYRNGVAIEDATEASLDIAWANRTPPAIYVCEAFFDVNGAMESSVSSPCTVKMAKLGMTILIR